MIRRIVMVGGVACLMNGCSLFNEVAPAPEDGYFEPKSAAKQDPYWERFYALEQEIAQLRAKMAKDEGGQVNVQDQPVSKSEPPVSSAEKFLARLRSKADSAVAAIDQAIAALETQTTAAVDETSVANVTDDVDADYAVTTVSPQIAVAGSMQRGDEGDVVGQVNHSQTRQTKYNYSLVYVYQEPQPWNEMWDRLEQANEQDKWRGSNPAKPSYFIYVGAYFKESDAMKRHDSLTSLIGEGPEMRANVQSSALASN